MNIQGTISYAAQEPWLFSETLRENILFGKPYNAEWYNTVVKACALRKVESYLRFMYSCHTSHNPTTMSKRDV